MASSSTETARTGRASDERIAWVDTAKGICIILVVMMHTTLGFGEETGREGWLHSVVAYAQPFRMPDFFLLSGLFLARVIDRDWRSYADKRVVHFAYFYVLWLVIQSLFKFNSVADGTITGFIGHLAYSMIEPFGTLWFLYMLAVFAIVTKLLRGVSPWVLLACGALLEIAPIETGSFLVNEFAGRYVYFLAGYLMAPQIFALAEFAVRKAGLALIVLGAWAVLNGVLAFTPSGFEHFPTLASLPVVSLVLGAMGAMAIVATAALLAHINWSSPLAYAGEHSIAIYLAFFLPMAIGRMVAIKFGLAEDVGTAAAIVTALAVITPLIGERIVRNTPLNFVFRRPDAFKIVRPRRQKLAAA